MSPAGGGSAGSDGGVDLELSIFGEDVVARRLLRFAQHAEDARPAFRRMNTILEAAALERFATEGAYGGEPWAQLAESTLKRKGSGKSILEASGRLLNSLVEGGVSNGGDRIRVLRPQEFHWGSDVPYGKFHQKGTKNKDGSVRMPRRRVVKLPQVVKRQIVKELQRTLVGAD